MRFNISLGNLSQYKPRRDEINKKQFHEFYLFLDGE